MKVAKGVLLVEVAKPPMTPSLEEHPDSQSGLSDPVQHLSIAEVGVKSNSTRVYTHYRKLSLSQVESGQERKIP